MVLTAVSLTASAAMRTTMSRRYHFTTPATTPAASERIFARWRTPVTPARSAAALTRTARSAFARAPARAPVMIQPSSRMIKAPRIDGMAEMRVASPAARPVSRAVGRSVTAEGIYSLFLRTRSETVRQAQQPEGQERLALGGLPRGPETISTQNREHASGDPPRRLVEQN